MLLLSHLFVFAAVGLAVLAGVAAVDKEFDIAALFLLGAAVCYGIKLLIYKFDDRYEEKRKTDAQQKTEQKMQYITLTDDVLGTIKFLYNTEEMMITAEKEQLPAFANGMSLSAVAYDDLITREGSPENAARKVIEAMRRVYNDKDEIISGMCGGYLSRCQSDGCTEYNGETVDEDMIRRTMQYERLWVGCDDGRRCNAELKAVPDPAILFDTAATAGFYVDEDGYEYKTRSNW